MKKDDIRTNEDAIIYLKEQVSNNATKLDLSDLGVDDEDIDIIIQFLKGNNTCRSLELQVNEISDLGITKLCTQLKLNNTLTSLCLGDSESYGEQGMLAIIDMLKHNSTLTHLYLNCIDYGYTDTVMLGMRNALINNNTLHTLYLIDNKIVDEGAYHLIDALAYNQTLTTICLEDNNINNTPNMIIDKLLESNQQVVKDTATFLIEKFIQQPKKLLDDTKYLKLSQKLDQELLEKYMSKIFEKQSITEYQQTLVSPEAVEKFILEAAKLKTNIYEIDAFEDLGFTFNSSDNNKVPDETNKIKREDSLESESGTSNKASKSDGQSDVHDTESVIPTTGIFNDICNFSNDGFFDTFWNNDHEVNYVLEVSGLSDTEEGM
jgi:hypothetical protein